MAISIRASKSGLRKVEQARKNKSWNADAYAWCEKAMTSRATLKRFRAGKAIQKDTFINICKAVGLFWEDIVETDFSTPTEQGRWTLTVEADDELLEQILIVIKQYSGEASLQIKKVETNKKYKSLPYSNLYPSYRNMNSSYNNVNSSDHCSLKSIMALLVNFIKTITQPSSFILDFFKSTMAFLVNFVKVITQLSFFILELCKLQSIRIYRHHLLKTNGNKIKENDAYEQNIVARRLLLFQLEKSFNVSFRKREFLFIDEKKFRVSIGSSLEAHESIKEFIDNIKIMYQSKHSRIILIASSVWRGLKYDD